MFVKMLELYAVILISLQRLLNVKYELQQSMLFLYEVILRKTLREIFYSKFLSLTLLYL